MIEKILERLEAERCDLTDYKSSEDRILVRHWNNCVDVCKEIVQEVSKEYGNGWISVSERLPELTEGWECFKQSKCCLVTLKWFDGDMTEDVGWYNQSGCWNLDSNNCKVIAWQPLPAPFKKGE